MNWTLTCARPPGGSDPFVSMTSCERQQGGISCNKIVCADISFVRSSPKYTRSRSLQWRTDPAMALDCGVAKRPPYVLSFTSNLFGSRAAREKRFLLSFHLFRQPSTNKKEPPSSTSIQQHTPLLGNRPPKLTPLALPHI